MKYEWCFNEKAFKAAKASTIEDEIYGWVFIQTEANRYYVDIHKEYYNSRDNGYDLEVYIDEDGHHGKWLGNVNEIRSASTLERFKKRAESLLAEFVSNEEMKVA